MSGWMILLALAVLLLMMGQIRVGAGGSYSQAGLTAWARLGPVRLKLWPRKEKPAGKKAKPAKPPKASPEKESTPPGGALDYARELVPLALEAAGQFRKKLRVDHLELEVRAGARDPADAAMAYGCANAALGALWLPLNEAFSIKDGSARVKLEFESETTTVYAAGSLSLKLGQVLWLGVYFGLKGLKKLAAVKGRRSTKDKERKAV